MAFTEIPILDLNEARSPTTREQFLQKLRDALLHVGFMYVSNTGVSDELCRRVCEQGVAFFDLPDEAKLEIEMKNKASFLGYSRVRCEFGVFFVPTDRKIAWERSNGKESMDEILTFSRSDI